MLRAPLRSFKIALLAAGLGLAACEVETSDPRPESEPEVRTDGRRVESTVQGEPVRQGFTHPPPLDADWLAPLPPPFLSDEERERSPETTRPDELAEAQSTLLELLGAFEKVPSERVLARIGSAAREYARTGRLRYLEVPELYEEYIYPSDIEAADRKYKGRLVVVTGRVAPENMTNPADGFKLFRRDPYVHEPLLLETPYETNFVRCHLARAADQTLSDWQTVHLLGLVEGKHRGDLVLRRCVVLTELD